MREKQVLHAEKQVLHAEKKKNAGNNNHRVESRERPRMMVQGLHPPPAALSRNAYARPEKMFSPKRRDATKEQRARELGAERTSVRTPKRSNRKDQIEKREEQARPEEAEEASIRREMRMKGRCSIEALARMQRARGHDLKMLRGVASGSGTSQ